MPARRIDISPAAFADVRVDPVVAQDRLEATLFRRAANWQPEVITRLEDFVSFKSIGLTLPLSAIYEGVISA